MAMTHGWQEAGAWSHGFSQHHPQRASLVPTPGARAVGEVGAKGKKGWENTGTWPQGLLGWPKATVSPGS